MPIRYRKSIGLGAGARLTLGKRGASMSFGIPGFRTSFHTSGRVTRTIGIPGTGISDVSRVGGGPGRSSRARTAQPVQASYSINKPGLFAGRADKRYFDLIVAFIQSRDADVLR